MKTYYIQYNIGKVKYVVCFNDGIKTHKDNSLFFDIRCFRNKKTMKQFTDNLENDNYKYKMQ